jgi:uncharacterized protein (TIGR00269 family)
MKCSFCKQESVYFRENEGHYYCKKHFIKNIEKKVKKIISINRLVENRDTIAVAHSGSRDSANVLFLLKNIFKNNPKIKFFVITLDEGIKGYSNSCVKKSESLCKKLGVKQYVFYFKKEFGFTIDELTKKVKSGYCESCNLLRGYLLNKKAVELGATKIATGYDLGYECESIVMNLLKGDILGMKHIGPIKKSDHPKFVTIIKPLITILENESILYGKINNIPSCPKGCFYTVDNSLRKEARKFLSNLEENSPGIKYSLYESALKIKLFINSKFGKEKILTCKKCGEPSSQKVCKVCDFKEKLSS